MAISAQRFKFLDKETNVGTIDFTKLTDNSVYTAAVDVAESAIEAFKEGESVLAALSESVDNLLETVNKATDAIMKKIQDALNGAIDKILNMKTPGFISKILDSLKALDLPGVKSFFKDLLKVGSAFLCNNLDFLKSFMLGYSLTENILSGILIGLLLSWLDRYCKGFSKQEMLAATNKGRLGMLFSNDGVSLSPNTVLGKFSNMYADLMRYHRPKEALISRLSQNEFLSKALLGEKDDIKNNFSLAKISSTDKHAYIDAIDAELINHDTASTEYASLIDVKTELESFVVTGIPDQTDFNRIISTGNTDTLLTTLRTFEISSTEKKKYLSYIDENLSLYTPGTTEYNKYLSLRGDLINLPLISQERMDKANAYSSLNDTIGSIAINLGKVDLNQINRHTLTDAEKVMLAKLHVFKENTEDSIEIKTRDHEAGSFAGFDINTLIPAITEEDKIYLNTLPGLEESHRYNNLHPTTEVFTEASMPGTLTLKDSDLPKPGNNDAPTNPTKTAAFIATKPDTSSDLYCSTPLIPGNCHV